MMTTKHSIKGNSIFIILFSANECQFQVGTLKQVCNLTNLFQVLQFKKEKSNVLNLR